MAEALNLLGACVEKVDSSCNLFQPDSTNQWIIRFRVCTFAFSAEARQYIWASQGGEDLLTNQLGCQRMELLFNQSREKSQWDLF